MTILIDTFGYDMTLNVYYKILKETEKTALVQEIGRTVNDDGGFGRGTSEPDPTKVVGQPFRATKRQYGSRTIFVSQRFSGGAEVWDGLPNYFNSWD